MFAESTLVKARFQESCRRQQGHGKGVGFEVRTSPSAPTLPREGGGGRTPLVASLALIALLVGIVASAAVADYIGRDTAPERMVRRYFAALEAGDAARALDQIAPATREQWSGFVGNGVLNTYRMSGIAVEVPSVQSRLAGSDSRRPRAVTVFLDITQWVDGVRWQAAPRVPLVQVEGRWYLQHPPLAPMAT